MRCRTVLDRGHCGMRARFRGNVTDGATGAMTMELTPCLRQSARSQRGAAMHNSACRTKGAGVYSIRISGAFVQNSPRYSGSEAFGWGLCNRLNYASWPIARRMEPGIAAADKAATCCSRPAEPPDLCLSGLLRGRRCGVRYPAR
jgi:hypothetical protein